MRSQTLIIGNGAAGFSAAKTLRDLDPQRSITVITHENEYFYSRPLITQYLTGESSRSALDLSSRSFYQEKGINLLRGIRVSQVEFDRQGVILGNREKIPFDQLLIASGGTPLFPGKLGAKKRGIYPLRTLHDAEQIKSVAQKSKHTLVAGGGLVGMKIAHALDQLGLKVTVIVSSPHLFSRTLDARASRFFQSLFESRGIRFFFNDEVTEIMERTSSRDQIWGGVTKLKRKVQGDFLVVGKGVKPNVALFEGSALHLQEGIPVDRRMKTNLPNVFAAGDVVEAQEFLTGKERVVSIWPHASEQGKIAAFNMAGHRREYTGSLGMNAFQFYDLSAISFGIIQPPSDNGYEERIYESAPEKVYQKIVLKEDKIVGAIFLQEIQNAGVIHESLKKGISIGALKEKLIKHSFPQQRPFIPMEVLF